MKKEGRSIFVESAVLNLKQHFLCFSEKCIKPKMFSLTDILYSKLKSADVQNRMLF